MAGNVITPSVVLYDASGTAMAVKDGVVVPEDTSHLLVGGEHESDGNAYHARVRDDAAVPTLKRLMVESSIAPGSTIQTTSGGTASTGMVTNYLLNGASHDMLVDGSGTPGKFTFLADPVDDIRLSSLRLVISANALTFDGSSFGSGGGVLPIGVSVDVVANAGTFTRQLASVAVNEDFLRLLDFEVTQAGSDDAMAASIPFGGSLLLKGGTADELSVTINDDLTGPSRNLHYFTATMYGEIL